jgi:hypothetical protein
MEKEKLQVQTNFFLLCLAFPLLLQSIAILIDEFWFHHRRFLPRWERWGHPLDTAFTILVLAYPAFVFFTPQRLIYYSFLALLSCFFVTKDEWVHAKHCSATENWLHAILFLAHPLVFVYVGIVWQNNSLFFGQNFISFANFLKTHILIMFLFLIYQVVYWNFIRKVKATEHEQIQSESQNLS